jgi:hypothetical protein
MVLFYPLTPLSRGLLGKPIVIQAVKIFPHGTARLFKG